MFTYGSFFRKEGRKEFVPRRALFMEALRMQQIRSVSTLGPLLGSAPLSLVCIKRLRHHGLPLRIRDPIQYFIGCFLDAGIRLMELASSLRCKLAEHISITYRV
jgi:hypothetical protein